MTQDDAAVLVCGAMVLGFSVTVMVACSIIAYRAIKDFAAGTKAFARRSRFKVLDGGRNRPVDSGDPTGYTGEHETGRKSPKPHLKR